MLSPFCQTLGSVSLCVAATCAQECGGVGALARMVAALLDTRRQAGAWGGRALGSALAPTCALRIRMPTHMPSAPAPCGAPLPFAHTLWARSASFALHNPQNLLRRLLSPLHHPTRAPGLAPRILRWLLMTLTAQHAPQPQACPPAPPGPPTPTACCATGWARWRRQPSGGSCGRRSCRCERARGGAKPARARHGTVTRGRGVGTLTREPAR